MQMCCLCDVSFAVVRHAYCRHPGLQVLVLYSTGVIRHQVAIAALSGPTLDQSAPDGSLQVRRTLKIIKLLLVTPQCMHMSAQWTCRHTCNVPLASRPPSMSRTSHGRRSTSFNWISSQRQPATVKMARQNCWPCAAPAAWQSYSFFLHGSSESSRRLCMWSYRESTSATSAVEPTCIPCACTFIMYCVVLTAAQHASQGRPLGTPASCATAHKTAGVAPGVEPCNCP
jgi:hypothetical protein